MRPSIQQTPLEDDFDPEEAAPLNKAEKAKKYASDLRTQFAALPMAIFADVRSKRLKHRDVCLYAHLLVKQGAHRTTFWGIDSLAILTGTNATSVKDSLSRLVQCGHIKRKRGNATTHTVCLTKLPPGEGVEGMLVKGRKVSEMPPEEIESELSPVPVRRMLSQISYNAPAQPSEFTVKESRNRVQEYEESYEPF